MKLRSSITLILITLAFLLSGCKRQSGSPQAVPTPSPSPNAAAAAAIPITLPVLDALFADEAFKADLKSKLQLTDEQIAALRKMASEEVARLRRANAEKQPGSAETARQNAIEAIRSVIGDRKSVV